MSTALSKKEQVLAAIAANLLRITQANGFNYDIALVERQHVQLRDEQLPCLFVNDSSESFEYLPDQLVQSSLTYVVIGGLLGAAASDPNNAYPMSNSLSTELNAFIKDFRRATYQNQFLNTVWPATGGQDLLSYHRIDSISTDEGFLNPKAVFVCRCTAQFRYHEVEA